jgi:hypothetical protein
MKKEKEKTNKRRNVYDNLLSVPLKSPPPKYDRRNNWDIWRHAGADPVCVIITTLDRSVKYSGR